MNHSTATKPTVILRRVAVIVCELFTLDAILYLLKQKATVTRLLFAFATLLLVLLPAAIEKLLHCRLWTPLYLYLLFYAVGPMCGNSLCFYSLLPGWDKLLHFSGGIVFALAGIVICNLLQRGTPQKRVLTAVFALCFSMAVSVGWEIYEFTADQLIGTDMQANTFIDSMPAYYFAGAAESGGTMETVQSVSINGVRMPWSGYMDLGLHDTMMDMVVETLGALLVMVYYLIDRGKHPFLTYNDPQKSDLP